MKQLSTQQSPDQFNSFDLHKNGDLEAFDLRNENSVHSNKSQSFAPQQMLIKEQRRQIFKIPKPLRKTSIEQAPVDLSLNGTVNLLTANTAINWMEETSDRGPDTVHRTSKDLETL